MLRSWLENILFPELKRGAMLVTLEPEMFRSELSAIEKLELVNRAIEIADVTSRHNACLVIRENDGSLSVYSIPDGPTGGGVTSLQNKLIRDTLAVAIKVA